MIKFGVFLVMAIQVVAAIPLHVVGFLWRFFIAGGLKTGADSAEDLMDWMSKTAKKK